MWISILITGYSPNQQMADELFKMPRIIEFVTELPKTISGKIRRVELRANKAQNKAKKITSENEFFYSK